MKRYLVFSAECYYPSGGWNDFEADFDTLVEAADMTKIINRGRFRETHIVDTDTGNILNAQEIDAEILRATKVQSRIEG